MKALIVSADLFEDTELLVPYYRLLEEKIKTVIASTLANKITGKHGYSIKASKALEQIDPADYQVLILPGGKAPSTLRENEKLIDIVHHFMIMEKIVAAICHGPQILVSAGVLYGRNLTCYKSIADEIINAGGHYKDSKVVVDKNLITSRVPKDLPFFMREIIKQCRYL